VRSAPEWYGNPVLEVMLLDHDEPTNYEEAMISPDSAKWLEAMKSEMGSMYGLVQASRSWNKCFDSVIKAYGFIQTFGEACIYKKVSGSTTAFLISICE
jgi:hypothetical protein